jgi:hypothetical protein
MCLKPGETGIIRLYTNEIFKKKEPTPTEKIITPTKTEPTAVTTNKQTIGYSCSQTAIIATAVASSLVTSLLVALLMKK